MFPFTFSPQKNHKKDTVLLPLFHEENLWKKQKPFQNLSPAQKRAVRKALRTNVFPQQGVFTVFSGDAPVLIMMMGKQKEYSSRDARERAENIAGIGQKHSLEKLVILPGALSEKLFRAFREGVVLGGYEFENWKGAQTKKAEENKPKKLKTIQFCAKKNAAEQKRLEALVHGVQQAKDIINIPSQEATPSFLAHTAQTFAKELQNVKVRILGEKELKKLGCGGILGVGKGSREESRLIILEYAGGKKKDQPIALVGKGVTFDTGGLSIKPSRAMISMKQDLGGAATVLGAFYAIAANGVAKNVLAVVPTVENLVSADAYKPDDILKMMNGVTVEIKNTDAEGRLILADALVYTCKHLKPRAIVDAATLTGSCEYTVGDDFGAVLGNDVKLIAALKKAGEETDEYLWELPLHAKYKKYLKSAVADIVNVSYKSKAGTIEAALFLQHFVEDGMPWAHLDIASVTFDTKSDLATGRNVRMLWRFVENY